MKFGVWWCSRKWSGATVAATSVIASRNRARMRGLPGVTAKAGLSRLRSIRIVCRWMIGRSRQIVLSGRGEGERGSSRRRSATAARLIQYCMGFACERKSRLVGGFVVWGVGRVSAGGQPCVDQGGYAGGGGIRAGHFAEGKQLLKVLNGQAGAKGGSWRVVVGGRGGLDSLERGIPSLDEGRRRAGGRGAQFQQCIAGNLAVHVAFVGDAQHARHSGGGGGVADGRFCNLAKQYQGFEVGDYAAIHQVGDGR